MTISEDRRFLGHPIGLGYLAFTEAWERFSFYGMQALLVLYMTKELLLPGHVENVALFKPFSALYGGIEGQALASAIFGTYAASVYLTPILGGFIADRVLGYQRSIMLGGALMAVGSFMLMAPDLTTFLMGLAVLVIGNGLFKPNISTMVGKLYKPGDARRDSGFTIFYMGINAGALVAPIICASWIGAKYGYRWGFFTAGLGMIIGMLVFQVFKSWLGHVGSTPKGQEGAGPVIKVTSAPSCWRSRLSSCSTSRGRTALRRISPKAR